MIDANYKLALKELVDLIKTNKNKDHDVSYYSDKIGRKYAGVNAHDLTTLYFKKEQIGKEYGKFHRTFNKT